MALDRLQGDANLYIGGLFSLRRKEALKNANITHVVSALRLPLDNDLFVNFRHHVVEVDDLEDENILEHFPASNAFIQQGLDGGGGVLVHCAVGKSRSATLLTAYLLSTHPSLTPHSALQLIRQTRPLAEPNQGFMAQLQLYHSTACTTTLDTNPAYNRWLYQRTLSASNTAGTAPEINHLRFSDESPPNQPDEKEPSSKPTQEPTTHYRCRRCRTPLATSAYLVPHNPQPPIASPCSHLHITPLSWMRPELELGKLEGRLECPNAKCGQSVGRYAWQGMKCSCGEWVVPGMTLGRGRVDEVRERVKVGGGKV